jgi:hypothetical protein
VSFLHPLILGVGLGAVAVPILIHFLRRRRRPIPWAAMRFLQEAMRKRKRRLKLEQLLLLACRVGLVALLALAVARPVIGGRPGSERPTVLVLGVDDSIGSALATGEARETLAASVEQAKRSLDALNPGTGDRAGLITLGAPGRLEVWPPTADLDAVRRALDRLTPTDSGVSAEALRSALDAAERAPDNAERWVVRLVSAWRGLDPERVFAGGAVAGVEIVEVSTSETGDTENLGVRSLGVSTPTVLGSPGSLAPATQATVTLERSGSEDERLVEVELIALPGGSIAGRGQARFAPGQGTAQAVIGVDDAALLAGPAARGQRVVLEARIPTDANPRDNTARTVLSVRPGLRVAVVERPALAGAEGVAPGVWVLAALTPDARVGIEGFRVDPASLGSVPAASMDAMVVLEPGRMSGDGWARARELLDRGGLVIITPDADGTPASWGDDLAALTGDALTITPGAVGEEVATRMSARDEPRGVLAGLAGELAELARAVGVRRLVRLNLSGPGEALLVNEDGSVLSAGAVGVGGRGVCVVFGAAIDLAWTDLPARPAFLPIVQELVRRGAGTGSDAAVVAGSAPPEAPGVDRWVFDADLSGTVEQAGDLGSRAGVIIGVASDGAVLRTLAVNPDAAAARTEAVPAERLNDAVEGVFAGASLQSGPTTGPETPTARRAGPRGDRLALLLLSVVAALAVIESLLARVASHPARSGASGGGL